ncbi:MAG TPA: DUF4340 domain-containing protein [Candidatus Binatus sp.]|uniref:DUF4340 domain-containing protein n=1 Tax=Candidatus Binatus sp. TaxID=2811406 RepID=UPI002B4A21C4|nr:DUF4340 domain-containing protein [Candidatus Binatus sp.]HKN14554.1 DUF4340 domain-containing protein [Candidatus Binatus sp.]
MSARPAIFYTIVFFILLPTYFWIQPSTKPATALEQKEESLLKLGGGIDAITVASRSESLRFQKTKDGKLYELVAPQGKFVPHDLMDAMVSLLTSAKSVEVVADNSTDLAQFGLDHPKSVVTIEAPGQLQPIKIAFGNENPTHTAIYAQIEGIPKVFLLGQNMEYYQSLMFQWIEGKQGKNA